MAVVSDNLAYYTAAPSGVRLETVTFTPRVAQEWLTRARANRPVVANVVREYARVMATGGWRLNGEPLIVNQCGELLNGQHRLRAVIESEASVQMLVVWGIQNEAFDTIDTGRTRSGRDLVGLAGYSDSSTLSTAARWLWAYEQTDGILTLTAQRYRPTNHELLDVLHRHLELQNSLPFGNRVSGLIGRGTATFCHYIFRQRHHDFADKFFGDLADGANLQKEQAVYLLRRLLQDNKTAKHKMSQLYQVAITIRAFNYERVGRVTKILRWRQVGPARETFPAVE